MSLVGKSQFNNLLGLQSETGRDDVLQRSKLNNFRYRPEIDGLRALAVVAVILNHFNLDLLPSGYLGVDIFFVISGFVITASLAAREASNFLLLTTDFFFRRFRRIFPALILCVLISGFFVSFFNSDPHQSLGTGISSLFGFSNIYLYQQSTDYFAISTELNVFAQTWSLGVEEQFYVVFPALVWFTGYSRNLYFGARNFFLCIFALSLLSLLAFIKFKVSNPIFAFFSITTRFWELGAGCLLFVVTGLVGRIDFIKTKKLFSLIPLFFLFVFLFLPRDWSVLATLFVVSTTVIFIASVEPNSVSYRILTIPFIRYIGLISYSLYLWHWPVLSISRLTIGLHWWSVPFQIILIVCLAHLSYQFVELPFRNKRWSIKSPYPMVFGLGALFGAVSTLQFLKSGFSEKLYLGRSSTSRLAHFYSQSTLQPKSCNLFEDLKLADQLSRFCGEEKGPKYPTFFVLGDSHGWQFLKSFSTFTKKNGFNLVSAWGNACPFPVIGARGKTAETDRCFIGQQTIRASLLKRAKSGDVVFFGNQLYAHYTGLWNMHWKRYSDDINLYSPSGSRLSLSQANQRFESTFKQLSSDLNSRGVKVVLYLDAPQFPRFEGGQVCSNQWFSPIQIRDECHASKLSHDRAMHAYFGWHKKWRLERPSMRFVFNASRYALCSRDDCTAEHYSDSNHFKDYYADYLWQRFLLDTPSF